MKAVFPAHAHSCIQSTKRLCPHCTAKDTPKGEKKVWVHWGHPHMPGHGSAWVALSNHVSSHRNFHPGISPEAAPDYRSNHLSSEARLARWMKLCYHFPAFENLGFLFLRPGYLHWRFETFYLEIISHFEQSRKTSTNSIMTHPLWKTIWLFLKKSSINLPYDIAIPLLGIYPQRTENRY